MSHIISKCGVCLLGQNMHLLEVEDLLQPPVLGQLGLQLCRELEQGLLQLLRVLNSSPGLYLFPLSRIVEGLMEKGQTEFKLDYTKPSVLYMRSKVMPASLKLKL